MSQIKKGVAYWSVECWHEGLYSTCMITKKNNSNTNCNWTALSPICHDKIS